MAITSFEIVSIPVSDPQKAKAFYRDVMGFDLIREESMGPDMTWIQLAPKGSPVTIALTTWFDNLKPGGQQGLMVNSDDIDADRDGADREGGRGRPDRSAGLGPSCDVQRPRRQRLGSSAGAYLTVLALCPTPR